MKYNSLSRRHFLQGVGGSLMTLPLLPSLIPAKAFAQAMQAQKFFVLQTVDHGGTGINKDWYPGAFIDNLNSNQFNQQTIIPGGGQNGIAHVIRHARLNNLISRDPGHDGGNVDNNQERLSFALGSFLNPYLNKMNMYVGVDGGMEYYGHSRSVTGGSIIGLEGQKEWPTVDHFLADSSKFYINRDAISIPLVNRTSFYSWTAQGTEYPATGHDVRAIYNAIFSRYQGTQDPAVVAARQKRSFLIDRVLEDLNRLVNGNNGHARRISSVDKRRLAQHAEHMYETERKYQSVINTCSDVTLANLPRYDGFWVPHYENPNLNGNSANPQGDYERVWDVLTDLLAAAFSCGATHIASLDGNINHFLYAGDYHADIVHQHTNSRSAQLAHNRNIRWQTQHIFGAMVRKLDAIDVGNGQTLLDRGLVAQIHEAGFNTHDFFSLGCVTAGSVDGFYNTGNFVDYRNLQNMGLIHDYNDPSDISIVNRRPGIPLQRFYANVLQAMGHVPADYRRNGRPGYGANQAAPSYNGRRHNPNNHVPYPNAIVNSFDDRLPIVA